MKILSWILTLPVLFLTSVSVRASTDLLMEDFEEPVSEKAAAQPGPWLEGDWTFEGTAFEGYGKKFGTRLNGRIAKWYPGQLSQGKLRIQGSELWGQLQLDFTGLQIEKGRKTESPSLRRVGI